MTVLSGQIIPNDSLVACSYSITNIQSAITEAINRLVNQTRASSQRDYEVFFKGSCFSLVELSFPDGAFFTSTPDDAGKVDTFFVSSGSTIVQKVPCNDVCCKVNYRWEKTSVINGETISKWVPKSFEGDSEECVTQTPPDYSSFTPQLEATIYDSINGQYNTVTGSLVNQTACELICPRFTASPPPFNSLTSVKTDRINKDESLQLSASPVPFNDYIKILSDKTILKVVMYDIKGKKVLTSTKIENGEINTSELKEGVYYLQVYLEGNQVKSLKVIK
jgi:hypothetical protein